MTTLTTTQNDIEQLSKEIFSRLSEATQHTDCEEVFVLIGLPLSKKVKKYVAGVRRPCYTITMPGKRAADKATITFQVPRDLKRMAQKAAKQRGETLSEFILSLLVKATINIQLTSEDYEQITQEIKEAERKLQA